MINLEQPPYNTDKNLSAYLLRAFRLMDVVYGNLGKLPVRKLLPDKPLVGKLYYFEQSIIDSDITAEGLYIYKSTGYEFIA